MSKKKQSNRGKGGLSERRVGTREPIERFLIVCEGERTEPNYFKSFRVPKDVITAIGVGFSTVTLVKRAIELRDVDVEKYDQVWCVFDRDEFPVKDFKAAITLAADKGIKVAYSNEAFELW